MMRQSLQQVYPERGHGGLGPAAIGGIVPLKSGVTTIGTRSAPSGGRRAMGVLSWRQRAPQDTFRQRVAGWRARNWRRAVLAWFVLSLIIMAVSAEPATDFPKAQAGSVPAVRMVLRVAGGLTAAGVPVLLVALP
jgi:hypothetical protein